MSSKIIISVAGFLMIGAGVAQAACGKVISVQTVSQEQKVHVDFQTAAAGGFELSGYNIPMDDPFKAEKIALAIAARTSGRKLCVSGSDLVLE